MEFVRLYPFPINWKNILSTKACPWNRRSWPRCLRSGPLMVCDSFMPFSQWSLEQFWCLYVFSSVKLPVPYMRPSLAALRRMPVPLHFPGNLQASVFPFPWSSTLSNAASGFITYAFAFPFWVEFAKQAPVRSSLVLHVYCEVAQKSWGMSVCTKALLRTTCARARQAGSRANTSKSYPNQRHCGFAAVVLSARELLAE